MKVKTAPYIKIITYKWLFAAITKQRLDFDSLQEPNGIMTWGVLSC